MRLCLLLPCLLAYLLLMPLAALPVAQGEDPSKTLVAPPKGKALKVLVRAYLDANHREQARMRTQWDATYAPLAPKTLPKLRKTLLKISARHGKKLTKSGTGTFYADVDGKSGPGKYIVSGKPKKTLFISLHGGGAGSGTATTYMGGGGFGWIYPQVLQATEHGWTDVGTEAFVMEIIQAAKRTFKIDANRVYITGHSMGGYGSWTLGAHHADVFAGIAAYAGAPTCIRRDAHENAPITMVQPGILPDLFNIPIYFYQSGDDKNVPPDSNDFAHKALLEIKKEFPSGFNFRYERVEGRGHAGPADGFLPSQKWIASHVRVPRPRTFLWQPVLPWKRHFYWVYWAHAEMESILEVRALKGNLIEIQTHAGSGDVSGLSVLLGAPLVDLRHDVTIKVNGEQVFRGPVTHTFSTLMMTLPRNDAHLLFDARVDL